MPSLEYFAILLNNLLDHIGFLFKYIYRNSRTPSSSAKLLSGFLVASLFQLSTLFLFTIRIGDLLVCLTLYYFLIFVLNPLLSKSNIGEPELFAGILRLFLEIWDILLLQILVIKFSVVKSYTLFQPKLLLKISSFLKIIVRISHDGQSTRIFQALQFLHQKQQACVCTV